MTQTPFQKYAARRAPYRAIAEQPMREINMTPLIDVMLVLLIMFIIIIPVALHKVEIDLPPPGPAEDAPPPITRNLDILPSGALLYEGEPVSRAGLAPRLEALATDEREIVLQVRADGEARYEDVDETLAVIARAEVKRLGFVGNHAFANYL